MFLGSQVYINLEVPSEYEIGIFFGFQKGCIKNNIIITSVKMRYESTDLTHEKFLSSVYNSEGWKSQLREERGWHIA